MARRPRPIAARPAAPEEVYEPIPDRPRRSWVVRVGIMIVGGAVIISSLMPLFEMFNAGPRPAAPDPGLQAVAAAEDAVVSDPADPVRWEALATALQKVGKMQEAALARAEGGRRRQARPVKMPVSSTGP